MNRATDSAGRGIVLTLRHVTVDYDGGPTALCEVGFDLLAGDVLGVLGEPGSGRTTLTRVITGLLTPEARLSSGRITLQPTDGGEPVDLQPPAPERRPSRWERVAAASPRILDDLHPVLTPRQRHADVLVIDDVTPTATALARLDRLRRMHGFAVVVTCADAHALRDVADEVAVLYGGRIVEFGRAADVWSSPHHPHTVSLLRAGVDPGLKHEVAAAPGCPFRGRCAYRMPVCDEIDPALDLVTVGEGGTTMAACLQYDEEARPAGPDPSLLAASAESVVRRG